MRYTRQHRGFALLMTLGLVALAAVALEHVARQALTRVLLAQQSVEDLQRKWATRSCTETFLPLCEQVLREAEREQHASGRVGGVREERLTLRLAEVDYTLVFSDEQSKVNVNALLQSSTPAAAGLRLRKLMDSLSRGDGVSVSVTFRPITLLDEGARRTARIPLISAFGQVFPESTPATLLGDKFKPGPTSFVTCWGSEKLNFHRADEQLLKLWIEPELGRASTRQLLEARASAPSLPLDELLEQASGLTEEHKALCRQFMTDHSTCHGLWVVASGPMRNWHTFTVDIAEDAQGALNRRLQFNW